ncbi:hypothetical protein D3C76_1341650 [compost metagenome]
MLLPGRCPWRSEPTASQSPPAGTRRPHARPSSGWRSRHSDRWWRRTLASTVFAMRYQTGPGHRNCAMPRVPRQRPIRLQQVPEYCKRAGIQCVRPARAPGAVLERRLQVSRKNRVQTSGYSSFKVTCEITMSPFYGEHSSQLRPRG